MLNGSIVGLLSSQPPSAAASLQPAPRVCLGIGIVRAVDAASGRLYVLTDLSGEHLEAVDVLQVFHDLFSRSTSPTTCLVRGSYQEAAFAVLSFVAIPVPGHLMAYKVMPDVLKACHDIV